ncbi:MAG: DUF4336 domain-containing protein [Candidatus Omnitrophica bacterium]|nr:DUF4336 domain-containing protein [Candidatus Omnitrophota bacterium]
MDKKKFSLIKKGSNKQSVLEELALNQIWVCRQPFRFFGIEIGVRMTVIRFPDERLFLHSPVQLDELLKSQLDKLGVVKYIVSPNNMHHFYIGDYFDVYPDASIYASPGLKEKRADLNFRYQLHDQPEDVWHNELDQILFQGDDRLQEIVLFHYATKTLLLGDLIMNFDDQYPPLTRMTAKFMGMYNQPVSTIRTTLTDTQKKMAKYSVERILKWDFDRIILSHGQIIKENGREIFKQAFAWLDEA